MRFYRLARTEFGPLPEHPWLKVGAVIRVPHKDSEKPGAQWNPGTSQWVIPVWVECEDPTLTKTGA